MKKGETILEAEQMVVWFRPAETTDKQNGQMDVYLERNARVHLKDQTSSDPQMFVVLSSISEMIVDAKHQRKQPPKQEELLLVRANQRRKQHSVPPKTTQQVQYRAPAEIPEQPELNSVQIQQQTARYRRVRIFPRSAVPYNVVSFESKESTPPEQVWVLTGGVNLLIDGIDSYGTIDLAADRIVIWTQMNRSGEFRADTTQSQETPFTVYLEGNIVIRQDRKVIRAAHAVYDAHEDRGLMLDAELKAFLPLINGNVRVRAERLRQFSRHSFHAKNAWSTTSEFGKPGYRLKSTDVFLHDRQVSPWLGGGETSIDPLTGAAVTEPTPWVRSLNNTLLIEDFPVLYAPVISGPAEDPNLPIRRITIGNDNIFGTQVETVWNAFQLLGMEEPDGMRLDLKADYYSKRGPGGGLSTEYSGMNLFDIPGLYRGEGLGYYINDTGKDNLGADRRTLIPETENRWRGLFRHRQDLPNNMTILGEIGYLSDRNFLEQYYENEFDRDKDNETLLYATQSIDNFSWSILGQPRVNDFEYETEWLPKGDLYFLGEPLLNGWINWSSHTSLGYGRVREAEAPTDPEDTFSPIPYMTEASGGVLMTRHELTAPFQLGALKIAPYVWGEAAFWEEDITGDQADRLVGSAGVRSSLLFWKLFPYVRSDIFNLTGLAHKNAA